MQMLLDGVKALQMRKRPLLSERLQSHHFTGSMSRLPALKQNPFNNVVLQQCSPLEACDWPRLQCSSNRLDLSWMPEQESDVLVSLVNTAAPPLHSNCNSVQLCAILCNYAKHYKSFTCTRLLRWMNKSVLYLSKFQPMERSIIQLVLHRTVSVGSQSSAVVLHRIRGAISDPAASFGHGQLQPFVLGLARLGKWSFSGWCQIGVGHLPVNWIKLADLCHPDIWIWWYDTWLYQIGLHLQ